MYKSVDLSMKSMAPNSLVKAFARRSQVIDDSLANGTGLNQLNPKDIRGANSG